MLIYYFLTVDTRTQRHMDFLFKGIESEIISPIIFPRGHMDTRTVSTKEFNIKLHFSAWTHGQKGTFTSILRNSI